MIDYLNKMKDLLQNEFLPEGQISQTPYDMASDSKDRSFEKETDKSFEEDRLDLEEILNLEKSKNKNYVKKVVKTVNKLIDGTADLDDLKDAVKNKKKKICTDTMNN